MNLDASNVVWLPLSQQAGQPGDARIFYLWGSLEGSDWYGSFVKLPPGFDGALSSDGSVFHAVVIRGTVKYWSNGAKDLTPGSYFGVQGPTKNRLASGADNESIIYVRTNGAYQLFSN